MTHRLPAVTRFSRPANSISGRSSGSRNHPKEQNVNVSRQAVASAPPSKRHPPESDNSPSAPEDVLSVPEPGALPEAGVWQ